MKEITVRIAVAVDEEGDWVADGGSRQPDGAAEDAVVDLLGAFGPVRISYVTARVPVPEAEEIEGEVGRE